MNFSIENSNANALSKNNFDKTNSSEILAISQSSKKQQKRYYYSDMRKYILKQPKYFDSEVKSCSFENSDFVFDCNGTLKKYKNKQNNSFNSPIDDYIRLTQLPIYYRNNNCCCCCCYNRNYTAGNNLFFMQTDGTLALSAMPLNKTISRVKRMERIQPIMIRTAPIPIKPKVVAIKNRTQNAVTESKHMQNRQTTKMLDYELTSRINKVTEDEKQIYAEFKYLQDFDKIEVPLATTPKKIENKSIQVNIEETHSSSESFENNFDFNKKIPILKFNDSLSSLDDFIRSPHNYYKDQELDRKLYNSDYSSDTISVGSIDNKQSITAIENANEFLNVVQVNVAPNFIKMPKSFVGKIGENAKFKCSFNGFPTPTITWYLNAVNLNNLNMPQKFKHYSKRNGCHYLKIFNIKAYDQGKITCVIENSMGNAKACVNLVVLNDQGELFSLL